MGKRSAAMIKMKSRMPAEVYSERLVENERTLFEVISALDEDEGIRVEGGLEGHSDGGFIFLGYYRGMYCVNTCDRVWDRKLKKYLPAGNDKFLHFDSAKKAYDYLIRNSRKPLKAWLY